MPLGITMLDQSFDSDVALDRSAFAGGATDSALDDDEDHGAQARSRALVDQAADQQAGAAPDPTRTKADPMLAGADAAAIQGRLSSQGFVSLGGGQGDVLFVTAIGADALGSTLSGGVAPRDDQWIGSQKVAPGVGITTPSLGLQKSQDPTYRYLVYGRIPADQVKYAREINGGVLGNPGFAAGSVEQGIALANVSMVIDIQSETYQKVRRGMILEQWLAEVAAAATASKGTPRSQLAIVNNERTKNMTNADYLASYVEWKRLVQGEEISTAEALAEIESRINANFDDQGLAVTNRDPLWSDEVFEQGKADVDAVPKPAPAPTTPAAERAPKPEQPPVASKLRQILEVLPGVFRVTFDMVIDTVARQFRPHPGEADGALPEVVSSREAGAQQTATPGHGDGRFTVEQLADESTRLLLKLKLTPEASVTAEELAKIKQQAVDGMNRFWDLQFTVTGNDGIPRPLRFAVDFVETGWHYEVAVKAGSGRDDSMNWYEGSGPQVRAHEMGHLLGLPDEYFAPILDSSHKDWPERSRMGSEWVKYDQSIMGHGSAPRERHGDMIASVMSTRDEAFDAAMASQVAMPALPAGRTAAELGEAIGWGRTSADALARAATITRADLDVAGFTAAAATEWLQFFRDAARRHPESASGGRATLMERAVKLLRGDD